jgi:hypothetical protein
MSLADAGRAEEHAVLLALDEGELVVCLVLLGFSWSNCRKVD